MTTDRLGSAETERLVDLVRRTRFFDLPEDLHQVVGRSTTEHLPRYGGRPVSLEIRAGRTVRRVVVNLDEARRPQGIDALVEAIERLPRAQGAAPEPATALHDLRCSGRGPDAAGPPAGGRHRVEPATARDDRPNHRSGPPTGPRPAPSGRGPAAAVPPPSRPRPAAQRLRPAGDAVDARASGSGSPAALAGASLLVAAAVVLLVAAGVVVWLVTSDGDTGGPGGGSPSTGANSSAAQSSQIGQGTTPAEVAYQALPVPPRSRTARWSSRATSTGTSTSSSSTPTRARPARS